MLEIKKLCVFYVCFIYYNTLGKLQNDKSKRIMLHSDEDIAAEVLALKNQVNAQASKISNLELQLMQEQSKADVTSSYIRWGRTVCPGNGSTELYKGFMSGTFLPSHLQIGKGAGANFLCLPDTPLWDHYTNTKNNDILVTGVEYNFNPHLSSAEQIKFFGTSVGRSEAPCAACQISRGSNIMIPGRNECFAGWTKEYSGYLVAGYPGYADSSEYVCLDRRPEVVFHSGDAKAENNLYFVESHCGGTLACPPYVDGRELSCVVCSM
ncbi:short-chain collagen C4-like [Mercenaria mercenaria]|uniref:short-chain collagen C4-like n=1 Tax=Mercenaria mercenaria TaxID=6596 RepID=UPI00234E646B|nr:short-chain collagen C4-like [Mercenaria mercenaria]